jgi:MFS family permease
MTQVLTSVTLAVAFGLTVFGSIRVEHLLVLAALSNTFRAFDEPSRMALIPQLVERDRLPNAIALGSIPWQAGRMIGPSITGILIAAFGGAIGFGMAAASSFIALALYSRLRLRAEARAHDGQHVLRQFIEGLSFVANNFVFAGLIGLALFNSLFAMSYLTLLPIFADAYFGAGSTGYGLLNAAHGTGALIGSLTIATMAHLILRRGTALLVGAASLGVLLILFSRSPGMGCPACGARRLPSSHEPGSHLPAQGARPPSRAGHEPALLCWNLLPLGALRRRAAAAVALRRALRRRHGVRERAAAAHVDDCARSVRGEKRAIV